MFGTKTNGVKPALPARSSGLPPMVGMLKSIMGDKAFADIEQFGEFVGTLGGKLERLEAALASIETRLERIETALATPPAPVQGDRDDG